MPETPQQQANLGANWPFRGFCVGVPRQDDLDVFKRMVAEVLPAYQCNTLVLLVRYQYAFQSHPGVQDGQPLTAEQASELAKLCRENGIRLIPKMNLMGHQSGQKRGSELGLLRTYPEFDETPELESVRYCRSLCPRHPKVAGVVFDLVDEIIDAFGADALHVGVDEVFEIGTCPRCKETHNAQLFAEWTNQLHGHIVGKREVEMLLWSDRLLDGEATGFGEWEASKNDTWQSIDQIPKDVLLCDWHYVVKESYPSLELFADKGFRHVICPWRELPATQAFLQDASRQENSLFQGVLQTSWCNSGAVARYLCDGDTSVGEIPVQVGESFKWVMRF